VKEGTPSHPRKSPERKRTNPKLKAQKLRHTKNIKIISFGEDETGKQFARLQIKVLNHVRTVIAPLQGFTTPQSSVFDLLNDYGAHLYSSSARTELINRVQDIGYRPSSFPVATRLGWHGQDFVLPDCVISPTKRQIRLYLDPERPERFDRYRVEGTHQNKGIRISSSIAIGPRIPKKDKLEKRSVGSEPKHQIMQGQQSYPSKA
jgi:hypothetical protein